MSDRGTVAQFLGREPGPDGLFRSMNGVTGQEWPHVMTFNLVGARGVEERVLAAYYEKSLTRPRADMLIVIADDSVVGCCMRESLRTNFIQHGDAFVLPHLMPAFTAYGLFHGCDVCGDPHASYGIGFSLKRGIYGQLFCRDHAPAHARSRSKH